MPTTEPPSSFFTRNFFEWMLLVAAIVGYGVVYVAMIYASALLFVTGLVLCGIIAGVSAWLQFFRKPKGSDDPIAKMEMENRFEWPKLAKERSRRLLTILRAPFK